jgi:hypothetical protein
VLLIVGIAICTFSLTADELPDWAKVLFQVASATAGAWLGAILQSGRIDSGTLIRTRTSIRQLVDHMQGLSQATQVVQLYRDACNQAGARIATERVDDWLERVEGDLRYAITTANTAIENWDDLSPGSLQVALDNYRARSGRASSHTPEAGPVD